jgi:hypothetical protein
VSGAVAAAMQVANETMAEYLLDLDFYNDMRGEIVVFQEVLYSHSNCYHLA